MYNEHRFFCDVDVENVAIIIEDSNFHSVCMIMEKTKVFDTQVEYVNIPTENTCTYGEYKCIFFSGNLFVINVETHRIKTIPNIEKIFYLDNSIFAITKKQSRYDGFVKIDINNFSLEHIGRFKYRNLSR